MLTEHNTIYKNLRGHSLFIAWGGGIFLFLFHFIYYSKFYFIYLFIIFFFLGGGGVEGFQGNWREVTFLQQPVKRGGA